MKFGTLWAKCWGLTLTEFGRDPRSSDSLRGNWNLVLFRQITHDFQSIKILRHFNTTSIGKAVKTFGIGTEFLQFYHKGSFHQKRKYCLQNFHVLRLQVVQDIITPQWLHIAGNSLLNGPCTGCHCLDSIFRSTPPSRPNNMGIKMSVRTSVRPQKFLPFQWNLVCRYRSMSDAWRYAVWADTRSRSRNLIFSQFLCHVTLKLAVSRSRPSVPYGANF